MEIVVLVVAVIIYRCIVRYEKRENEQMRADPPVRYIGCEMSRTPFFWRGSRN